jgi:hypothetical protein
MQYDNKVFNLCMPVSQSCSFNMVIRLQARRPRTDGLIPNGQEMFLIVQQSRLFLGPTYHRVQ